LNSLLTSAADAELGLVAMERLTQFAELPPEDPLSFPALSPLKVPVGASASIGALAPAKASLKQPIVDGDASQIEEGTTKAEAACGPPCDPPSGWPTAGAIAFEDVRMRYRPGLPEVLRGLSFSVAAGHKIGIAG